MVLFKQRTVTDRIATIKKMYSSPNGINELDIFLISEKRLNLYYQDQVLTNQNVSTIITDGYQIMEIDMDKKDITFYKPNGIIKANYWQSLSDLPTVQGNTFIELFKLMENKKGNNPLYFG